MQAGDITAATALEEIIATGMMIVGVVFFGWLISSISDLMDVRPCFCLPPFLHFRCPSIMRILITDAGASLHLVGKLIEVMTVRSVPVFKPGQPMICARSYRR